MTHREAAARLLEMDRVLILTHVRPDGDTVGCAAALCAALRKLGKTAYLYPNPGITKTYESYAAPYWAEEDFAYDYVVAVDIATLGMLPENAQHFEGKIDLSIDHHPSNSSYAKENLVETKQAFFSDLGAWFNGDGAIVMETDGADWYIWQLPNWVSE